MKEPGQIAYEAWLSAKNPDGDPLTNWLAEGPIKQRAWAAVEAACRAEGMREAAGIAAKHANGSAEWSRHATAIETAIITAIGGQK